MSATPRKKNANDYAWFMQAVRSGDLARFYLLCGNDFSLREECIMELRAVLGEEYSYSSFQGGEEENGLGRMVEEARTPDFFKSKKLLYLRGAEAAQEWEYKALVNYLDEADDDCVICAGLAGAARARREKAQDEAKADFKAASKLKRLAGAKGVLVELKPPRERALSFLLTKMAGRQGMRFSDEATHYLVSSCGEEPRHLRDEVDKLTLFFAVTPQAEKRIGLEDLRGYVNDMRVGSSFDFTDYVGERNMAKALAELSRLSLSPKQAIMLVGLLAHRFRILRQVAAAERQGVRGDEMAAYLGLLPHQEWLVRKYRQQAAKFEEVEYPRVLERLLKLDLSLKRSGGAEENLFSCFVQDTV